MISCVIGLHGSGKTWFMVHKFLYPAWKRGENILTYNDLLFSDDGDRVQRFWQLSDLFTASNCLIGFPELQKLLNASAWRSLPPMFADMLCQHRHSQINLVGDTQSLAFIDPFFRRNIAELFVCKTVIRIPIDETKKPFFHWIRVQRKIRDMDEKTDRINFKKSGHAANYFISRWWTKTLYDTYEKSNLSKYLIWGTRRQKKWTVHMVNRQLIASGRVSMRQ